MRTSKKICFIASSGGHLEQIEQLDIVREKFDYYYVLPRNKSTVNIKKKRYLVGDFYRKHRISFIFRFLFTTIQQFFIFLKERPDIVITTGAGVVIPTCLIAKFFRKKLIYIESFARMRSLNETGKLLYRYADLFVVQWEELLELCPKAIYGGWIY